MSRARTFVLKSFALALIASPSFAANPRKAKSSDSPMTISPSSGKGAKNFAILGIGAFNTMRAHVEYNLFNQAGIGLEYGAGGQEEMLTKRENDELKSSLKSKSEEFALTISRYSKEHLLGGFYWTLGVGYQTAQAKWHKKPDTGDARVGLVDQEGRLNQELTASGPTGHGRFGYRFVSEEWPIGIGAFLGFKHFDGTLKDKAEDPEQAKSLGLAKTTPAERKQTRRILMTTIGLGIELGMAF